MRYCKPSDLQSRQMCERGIVVSCHNRECHYGRCVGVLFQSDHLGTLGEDTDESEGDYIARRKALVSSSVHLRFVCRRLTASRVCIAIIVQVASLAQSLKKEDQTRAMMKPIILQQVVMNLSILTAVIISLHNFIGNLTAGGFGVEVRGSSNGRSNVTSGITRQPINISKASSRAHEGIHARSSHSPQWRMYDDNCHTRADEALRNSAWAKHEEGPEWEDSDERSHSSQENIILQTVTWQVSRHEAPSLPPIGHVDKTPPPRDEPREANARDFVM
jgi:hypothetical protein